MIPIFQIVILALVQGMAELLPVSSSAHVIVAEKLMGIDPTSPEMTFLLVMLHTGTMFAVLLYFRRRWVETWNRSASERGSLFKGLLIATGLTAVVGLGLKKIIEKTILGDVPHAEIEQLFGKLPLIGAALLAVGVVILVAGLRGESKNGRLTHSNSAWIGAIQGLCLPFRGFSRSGATISVGMLTGVSKMLAEEFSFALAVILTPPVVARELLRLLKSHALTGSSVGTLLLPGLLGMVFSFVAGLLALRWVSSWIEEGRWKWFAYYCFFAAGGVFLVNSLV